MNKLLPILLVLMYSWSNSLLASSHMNEIKILLKSIINIEKDSYKITATNNDNFYLVVINHSTHDRNYIYNVKNEKLYPIGDGRVEFKDNAIYRYWAKSYFDNVGGAFWYNIKVNYSGEYIELVNMEKDAKCYGISKFKHMPSEFISTFKKQKLNKLCVWHK